MDLNILFEMTQGASSASDVTNKLMSSKAQNKEFSGMFDNLINKIDESNKSNNVDVIKNENVVSKNDTIDKTTDKDLALDKTDDTKVVSTIEDKIEDTNVINEISEDIDDDKEKINDASIEALGALLQMLQEKPEDMKIYFTENEDGTFEINLDNLDLLKTNLETFISDNNLNVDIDLLNEDQNFDFEKLIDVSLDFTLDEVNKQVKLVNIFTMDNEEENSLEELPIINEENVLEVEAPIEEKDDNNFNILKDVINEMIDEVNVVKNVKEVKTEEVVSEVSEEIIDTTKDIKEDNEIVITDEKVSLDEDTSISDEKVDKVVDNNIDSDEEIDHKEIKKDHKEVKQDRVLETKPKNEFNISKVSNENIIPEDLSDVIDENLMSNSVTDRFIETINVTKQMVKHVELNISEGVQEMNIKLDPENLGKVNLKIVAENGLVQAKFEAENQKVKEIIESNLSLLKESLEKRGVEVTGLSVSVGQNMNNQNNERNLDEIRKIAQGKNPHKILGKGIKIFNTTAEINNSELRRRGLYMTKSQLNYIA